MIVVSVPAILDEGVVVGLEKVAFRDDAKTLRAIPSPFGQALGLGDRKFVEDFLDDRLGGFLLGLGLERDGHAMA